MRDETQDDARRDAMAIAAAPFCHPKLSPLTGHTKIDLKCLHELATLVEQVAAPVGGFRLSPTTWASAISATSRGKLVRSAVQSRREERKPWTVIVSRSIRRSNINKAILDSARPPSGAGKTKSGSRL